MIILGAGGLAREIYWHLQLSLGVDSVEVFFVDDVTERKTVQMAANLHVPVIKNWDFSRIPSKEFIVGVGSPSSKRLMVEKALANGLKPANPIIAGATLLGDIRIGKGTVVAPGCILTTDIDIGDFVMLNLSSTVGHDTKIGDFCNINPGCHISGNVTLGTGVSLGSGTVVRDGMRIASDVTTGAMTCVVSHLDRPGVLVVGVPGKVKSV